MNFSQYTTQTVEQVEKEFHTNLAKGLNTEQVLEFQKKYGANSTNHKTFNTLKIFLRQLTSPFVYLLIASAIISYLLEENKLSSIMIIIIVLLNTLLGFIQEYRAARIAQLLKKHLAIKVKVKRDNQTNIVNSEQLVPGDIIILQPGDYIPADIRFIKTTGLSIDESALTGESIAVKKSEEPLPKESKNIYDATNIGFLGTIVTTGSATAVVIATGYNTFFSSISTLTQQAQEESSFQIRVKKLSIFIMRMIVITLIILFIFHLIINPQAGIIQLLLFSITLAIGITPEALPVVTTFALSRGALTMAKNNVIVKRLSAIEDMGSITILCTDKTGTLTENQLELEAVYGAQEHNPLLYSLISAEDKKCKHIGAIDKALWEGANREVQTQVKEFEVIKEIPFDSFLIRNIVLVKKDNHYELINRGGFEVIIPKCKAMSKEKQTAIDNWLDEQSSFGRRILALSYKKLNHEPQDILKEEYDMEFIGFVSLEDPIKESTQHAVDKAKKLGITLKMLTGDSAQVAYAVGKKVKLISENEQVMTGDRFSQLSDKEKLNAVNTHTIFARILPQQKYEIVKLLRTSATVGYLGDGINDAPALKISDVGISVSDSVDIAKDAADIVLLKKSLNVIINGIAQGRKVFANILKYIKITIAANFGGFYSIAIAALFTDFLPLLPLQILLINLLSDMPMIAIATDSVDQQQLAKPSDYNLKDLALQSTFLGLVSSVFDFMFFVLFYKSGSAILRTVLFTESVLTELVLIFSARTQKIFFKASTPSLILTILAIFAGFLTLLLPQTQVGQIIFGLTKLNIKNVTIILILVITYFITTEIVKLVYYKWMNNKTKS